MGKRDIKTAMMFEFLTRVYQSWWRRKVDKVGVDVLVADWSAVLAGLSDAEIKAGMDELRARRNGARLSPPPSAAEFGAIAKAAAGAMVRAPFDARRVSRPAKSEAAAAFFASAREILAGPSG